jgi:hypothetical protein
MALMERLRRVEAGIEWLETEGQFRLLGTKIKLLKWKERVEAELRRDPGHAGARQIAPYVGVALPPLPQPPRPAPVVRPPPAPPAPPEPQRAPVVVAAPAPPMPLPPEPEPPAEKWETHDIPEHMQIRPVTWRRRGLQDVDDLQDGSEDGSDGGSDAGRPGSGQCLTDYDPLAEEDS